MRLRSDNAAPGDEAGDIGLFVRLEVGATDDVQVWPPDEGQVVLDLADGTDAARITLATGTARHLFGRLGQALEEGTT